MKMTRPSSEIQAELDAAFKTLKDIRKRLAELKAEQSELLKDERTYLDSPSDAGIIKKLKHELTRSKSVEFSYAVNAIPVVMGIGSGDYVVQKITAKQIYCCTRDGSSGFQTLLTGICRGRQFIDMQATFGKDCVEPNSINTGIVLEPNQ
jgi:hypothetical protein